MIERCGVHGCAAAEGYPCSKCAERIIAPTMTAEMLRRASFIRKFFIHVHMTDIEKNTPDPDYGL